MLKGEMKIHSEIDVTPVYKGTTTIYPQYDEDDGYGPYSWDRWQKPDNQYGTVAQKKIDDNIEKCKALGYVEGRSVWATKEQKEGVITGFVTDKIAFVSLSLPPKVLKVKLFEEENHQITVYMSLYEVELLEPPKENE